MANSGARERQAVPASYKTPAVLLIYIYTVKSGKSLGSDNAKWKENIYVKVKDPFSFEICIFCSGQPDCDDDNFCSNDFNLGAT